MKRFYKIFLISIFAFSNIILTGCSQDDDTGSSSSSLSSSGISGSKPVITLQIATATKDDLEIIYKVKSETRAAVKVLYGISSTNLNKTKNARIYNTAGAYTYYKASITGLNEGTKYYFKGIATNSVGTSETSTSYTITKR